MGSATALATMCPDAGHMNHMPAHVHVLCGEYQKAKLASARAIAANDRYLGYAGALTPYTHGMRTRFAVDDACLHVHGQI